MTALYHAFSLVQYHFGHLHVTRSLFVEGRCHDFGLDVARHFRNLFGAFVDQQYDHVYFGMVVGDGVGDSLQQHGLTGLGLRHDQGALAFADGRKEVHDAGGEVVVSVSRQTELLAREERRHEFELYAVADVFGRQPVDFVHADQREIFLALLRRTDRSVHGVAGLESEKLDLRRRNVDVVGRVQVVVVRRTQESVTVGHDLQHALAFDFSGEVVLGNHLLL